MNPEDSRLETLSAILKGAGVSFIIGMIGYVLVFFFKLFAARVLGAEGFGLYEMVVTIVTICATIASFGFGSAIVRYVPYYEKKKQYGLLRGFKTFTLTVKIIASVIMGIILYVTAPYLTNIFNFGEEFTTGLQIISAFIPFIALTKHYSSLLYAYKKIFFAKLPHNIIENLILLLGVLILYIYDFGFVEITLILGIAYFVTFLVSLISYNFVKKVESRAEKKYLVSKWFSYSYPLLFTGMVGFLLKWADNLLIGYYLDASSLGVYAITFSLGYYVVFFARLVSSIAMPFLTELYATSKKELFSVLEVVKKWVFLVSSFFALVLIVFSKEVLQILFGAEFSEGHVALSVMSFLFLISVYFYFYNLIINISEDTSKIFYNTSIFMSLNVILNIVLIPVLGILGAAIATGSSYALLRFGEAFFAKRKFAEVKYFSGIKSIVFVITNLIILYIVKEVLFLLPLNTFLKIILAGIIYAITFTVTFLLFKLFSKQDIKLILLLEKEYGLDLIKIKNFVKKII